MGNLRREVIFRDREAEVGEEEEEKQHVAKAEEGQAGPFSSVMISANWSTWEEEEEKHVEKAEE